MSIIGKKCVPTDNSYSLNLSRPRASRAYLAGTHGSEIPKEVEIISEPYDQDVFFIKMRTYKFINVRYEGDTHRIMYFEEDVGANLYDRIRKNNNNGGLGFMFTM